jgi:hypothetical protein
VDQNLRLFRRRSHTPPCGPLALSPKNSGEPVYPSPVARICIALPAKLSRQFALGLYFEVEYEYVSNDICSGTTCGRGNMVASKILFINSHAARYGWYFGRRMPQGYRLAAKFWGSGLIDRTETLNTGFPYRNLYPLPAPAPPSGSVVATNYATTRGGRFCGKLRSLGSRFRSFGREGSIPRRRWSVCSRPR